MFDVEDVIGELLFRLFHGFIGIAIVDLRPSRESRLYEVSDIVIRNGGFELFHEVGAFGTGSHERDV